MPARLHEYPEETWGRLIDVNLKGVWLCLKYEVPEMFKQSSGVMVNTVSAVGLVGGRQLPAYVASKHGVVGLTKEASLEYATDGIRVNAVCPGVVDPPMFRRAVRTLENTIEEHVSAVQPIGRMGTPEEIAESVAWLFSDAASLVTGFAMPVDGGYTTQ